MKRRVNVSLSRESRNSIQSWNSNAGVPAAGLLAVTRRSGTCARSSVSTSRVRLLKCRLKEFRAILNTHPRNKDRSRTWPALRYTVNITSCARSSAIQSHPRDRKNATSCGLRSLNKSAKDSSLGRSRNLSSTTDPASRLLLEIVWLSIVLAPAHDYAGLRQGNHHEVEYFFATTTAEGPDTNFVVSGRRAESHRVRVTKSRSQRGSSGISRPSARTAPLWSGHELGILRLPMAVRQPTGRCPRAPPAPCRSIVSMNRSRVAQTR